MIVPRPSSIQTLEDNCWRLRQEALLKTMWQLQPITATHRLKLWPQAVTRAKRLGKDLAISLMLIQLSLRSSYHVEICRQKFPQSPRPVRWHIMWHRCDKSPTASALCVSIKVLYVGCGILPSPKGRLRSSLVSIARNNSLGGHGARRLGSLSLRLAYPPIESLAVTP